MCQSPSIIFTDYKPLPDHAVKNALKMYSAEEDTYSLLIFTSGFNHDKILIMNDKTIIYDSILQSDKSMGLAKAFRINNTLDVKVRDFSQDNYFFKLNNKKLKNYKYIYIEKNKEKIRNKENPYTIIFSNTLRGFK